jgi:hypothetical protein
MKKFMALYLAPAIAREQAIKDAPPEVMKGEMKLWELWRQQHADSIVEAGGPLGKTKSVGIDGVTEVKNEIDGYSIIQAESHEEAAKLFGLDHPHFNIVGATVEVMELVPMPTAE